MGFRIRKVADMSKGSRVVRYDPNTGAKILVNPESGKAEPWPLLGIVLETKPQESAIPTKTVARGIQEGWIKVESPRWEVFPGGNESDPYKKHYSFVHGDVLRFVCLDEIVRYEIISEPRRWFDINTGRYLVTHEYGLKLLDVSKHQETTTFNSLLAAS
jgi:hypothetical protein